jgi:hypothetical protein
MNNYFYICWTMSYIFAYISLVVHAWRWADEVGTLDALLFWLAAVSVFGIIGIWLLRNFRENGGN